MDTKKKIDKSNFYNYIVANDISLKYLEDVYLYQSKGIPVIKKNSIIKIKRGCCKNYDEFYGIVASNNKIDLIIRKNTITYIRIDKDDYR